VAQYGIKADALMIEAPFASLLTTGKKRFRAMGLPASPFAELLLFWGGVQNGFNAFTHNPVDYARAVKQPTLILHGGKDERTTIDEARSIAAAIGSHARWISYEEVPHLPIVERRRDDWSRDAAEFLEKIR
jgi:pimeloyl-ACP methyl ester carboxylesterase